MVPQEEKIEEMAKEFIKELEKDCPDIWDKMIHQIRITDVRVERLQDTSDEDCIKEGIRKVVNENGIYVQ